MLSLKQNCKYALIVPTSIGVRITPPDRQPVHTSTLFSLQSTSAETNVAQISASLGLKVKVLTTFVKGSPIADFIKSDLRRRNLEYEGVDVDQGGPWGYRHQFNIADSGFGVRGPRVHNDRAGEVGRTLNVKDFDLKKIFETDGVEILHVSGLIVALSKETSEFCLELCRYAKKCGTIISFDLNYRESFWKGRKEELFAEFKEIASLADILVGNEEDFQLALGFKGPEAGGKEIKEESFKNMITEVKKAYPQASVFATTLRKVLTADRHLWGAIALFGDEWHYVEQREIPVLDRIGGGDGFVGGLLYAIEKGFEAEKALDFAWASGALAVTVNTDYAVPADEDQIWSIFSGNARVKR